MKKRFKTKREADCTHVVSQVFDEKGDPLSEGIINSFSGTGNGRGEAQRYARLLNDAVDRFMRGEDVK